jgi:protein ImuB
VWFPLWPIQRDRSARPEVKRTPLALYETTSRGERLVVCSPLATRQGLRPGQSKEEAEILAAPSRWEGQAPAEPRTLPRRLSKESPTQIQLFPIDRQADRETLHELALQARARFSPLTALEDAEHPECLFLDIEGCEHLFDGERALLKMLVHYFRTQGWKLRCALADTAGLAWALAHSGDRSVVIIPPGEREPCLRPLPLAALRIPYDDIRTLTELGVERVGQLLNFPRKELAARFSPVVVQRLRQALGIEPELLVPVREPEPIVAKWSTDDPLSDQAALEILCGQLLDQVLNVCRGRGVGLLQCLCRLEAEGHLIETYPVELVRPTEDASHVLKLLELQWEQRTLPSSIHTIVIEAARTTARVDRKNTLFDDGRIETDRLAAERLVERLSSRLGKASVLRVSLSSDAQPEFSVRCSPWLDGAPTKNLRSKKGAAPPVMPQLPWERPLTLLLPSGITVWSVVPDGPPQRVRWKEQLRAVLRWWGPERIETGWWQRRQCHREYYRVELESGEWLWIFRSHPEANWFLQGVFD